MVCLFLRFQLRLIKVMLGMNDEQAELYRWVEEWVKRDLGNA